MLESELYDREFNDNTTGGRGAGELNPAVPAAVFQPPQVVFQPPTARPEPVRPEPAPSGQVTVSPAPAGTSGNADGAGSSGDDDEGTAAGRRRRRRPSRGRGRTGDRRRRMPATVSRKPRLAREPRTPRGQGGSRGPAGRGDRRRPARGPGGQAVVFPHAQPPDQRGQGRRGHVRGPVRRPRGVRVSWIRGRQRGRWRQRSGRGRRRGRGQHCAPTPPQAPPRFGRGRGRAGLADPGRPAGHRRARPRAERQRRRAVGPGVHQARGEEAAASRRPGHRPPPPADRHRVGVPRPPRVGRAVHGGPPAQGPHPDRRARRRRAGRALREPVQPSVLRRQRLPGQGPERAAVDGGRLRRRRQGPQRGALRRRGQFRRQRA